MGQDHVDILNGVESSVLLHKGLRLFCELFVFLFLQEHVLEWLHQVSDGAFVDVQVQVKIVLAVYQLLFWHLDRLHNCLKDFV